MGASAPPPQGGMTRWQVHGDVHLTTPSLVGMAQEQGQCWGAGPSLMGAAHPPCHPISLVRRQPVGRLPQGLGSGLQPLRVQPGRHAAGRAGHPRVGQRDAGNAQRWAQGWRCLPLPGAAWAHPRGSPQHIPCCSPRCSPDAAALPNSLASLSASMLSRLHPSIYPLPCPPVHHRRVCCSVPVHPAVSAASPQCSATVIVASLLSLVHFLTPVHPCCLCCTPPPPHASPHFECIAPASASPPLPVHFPHPSLYLPTISAASPQCSPTVSAASPNATVLSVPSPVRPCFPPCFPTVPLHPQCSPASSAAVPTGPFASSGASQLFLPHLPSAPLPIRLCLPAILSTPAGPRPPPSRDHLAPHPAPPCPLGPLVRAIGPLPAQSLPPIPTASPCCTQPKGHPPTPRPWMRCGGGGSVPTDCCPLPCRLPQPQHPGGRASHP